MAAERYLSRRIPDLRVGNNIDEIDKKLIPASIHPCLDRVICVNLVRVETESRNFLVSEAQHVFKLYMIYVHVRWQ